MEASGLLRGATGSWPSLCNTQRVVAHCSSTLRFDVTMVSPRVPKASARNIQAPVFPGYNVVRQLASGGMGVVYEGYHRSTGVHVAIKAMRYPSHEKELQNRFLGEIVAAQRIDHRSITEILDFGYDASGYPFLIMEFIEGESLDVRVGRGDLSVAEFCQIAEQLIDVIAAAHRAGVLHRDIKPSNIILMDDPREPGTLLVKLIDFGVAKFVHGGGICENTADGVLIGTPAYMSPEQCLGSDIDERSDIYSIGCLLYELLTNRCPFVGSIADVLVAHRGQRAVPVSIHNSAIPPRLASLVDRMLEKRPSARPSSMNEVAYELALLERDRRGSPPPEASGNSYAAIPKRVTHQIRSGGPGRLRVASAVLAIAVGCGAAFALIGF